MLKVQIGVLELSVRTFANSTTVEIKRGQFGDDQVWTSNGRGGTNPKTDEVKAALKAILAYIS